MFLISIYKIIYFDTPYFNNKYNILSIYKLLI